jgi:hypothetical protein
VHEVTVSAGPATPGNSLAPNLPGETSNALPAMPASAGSGGASGSAGSAGPGSPGFAALGIPVLAPGASSNRWDSVSLRVPASLTGLIPVPPG